MEEDLPRKPATHEIGSDLSRHSLDDLVELRAALVAELARLDAEVEKRRALKNAAEAFFKPPPG